MGEKGLATGLLATLLVALTIGCAGVNISAGVVQAQTADLTAERAKELDSSPPTDAVAIVEIYDQVNAKFTRVYLGHGFGWAEGGSTEPGYQLWIPQKGAVSGEANHFVVWMRPQASQGTYEVTILLTIDGSILSLEPGAKIEVQVDREHALVRMRFDGHVKLRDESIHPFGGRLVSKIAWAKGEGPAAPPSAPAPAATPLTFGGKPGMKSDAWDLAIDAAPVKVEENATGLAVFGPPAMLGKVPFFRLELTTSTPNEPKVLEAK